MHIHLKSIETMSSLAALLFIPAAVSEVSGGSAAVPTSRLFLGTLPGFCDSPGDHQRQAWGPVPHRHPENQETAVRTPTAMMSPTAKSTVSPARGTAHHTFNTTRCQCQPWLPRMYIHVKHCCSGKGRGFIHNAW